MQNNASLLAGAIFHDHTHTYRVDLDLVQVTHNQSVS